jgi:enoyl-CoA hydratase/carnithine racemase
MGLVNAVHEEAEFEDGVDTLAAELAAKPPLAVAAILCVLNRSQDLPLSDALDFELKAFSLLAGSRDNIEGVMALFEKRTPIFTGE